MRRIVRVERMADLTGAGNRSPMTRTTTTVSTKSNGSEKVLTERSNSLNTITFECLRRRSFDEISETVRSLFSLFSSTGEQSL